MTGDTIRGVVRIVIEARWQPAGGAVTGRALQTEMSGRGSIAVAGNAVGCVGDGMVEGGICPTAGAVTVGALIRPVSCGRGIAVASSAVGSVDRGMVKSCRQPVEGGVAA